MTTRVDLSADLAKINASLRAEGVGLRIEQRGRRLNLRGPLPCRTTAGKQRTQRLSLGLTASHEGLQEARQLLQLVDLQLRRNQFDWQQWTETSSPRSPQRP